jgi:hypothetical protein
MKLPDTVMFEAPSANSSFSYCWIGSECNIANSTDEYADDAETNDAYEAAEEDTYAWPDE